MPIFEGTGHGDLFVTYNVVLPTSLNAELKQSKLGYLGYKSHHLKCLMFTELSEAFGGRAGAGPEAKEEL